MLPTYRSHGRGAENTENDFKVFFPMAGARPLTSSEERLLVRYIRRINARDRALISAQLFLGFLIEAGDGNPQYDENPSE